MKSPIPTLLSLSLAVACTVGGCTSVNHDLDNAVDAKPVKVDGKTWYVNVRPEDNAIWIQNPDMLGLTTGPTRPDAHFMKVARMHVPEGCSIVFFGEVQNNSREALYEC